MTQRLSAFTAPGRFWRGNLHTHSNISDGVLTPQRSAAAIRPKGMIFWR